MAQLIEEKTSNIKHNFVPSQTSRQNDSKEELSSALRGFEAKAKGGMPKVVAAPIPPTAPRRMFLRESGKSLIN